MFEPSVEPPRGKNVCQYPQPTPGREYQCFTLIGIEVTSKHDGVRSSRFKKNGSHLNGVQPWGVYAPKTILAAITAVVLRSVVFTFILKNTGKEVFIYFFILFDHLNTQLPCRGGRKSVTKSSWARALLQFYLVLFLQN